MSEVDRLLKQLAPNNAEKPTQQPWAVLNCVSAIEQTNVGAGGALGLI